MVSRATTRGTPAPEIEEGNVGSDENNLTQEKEPAIVEQPSNVGQMTLTLFEGDVLEISFQRLGRLTPGRIEKAANSIYRAIMLARSATERGLVPQPFRLNLRDLESGR